MYTFTAKIYQLQPKIFPYLDTSTSTGSLHQKNDNIIFSSGFGTVSIVPRKQTLAGYHSDGQISDQILSSNLKYFTF